MANTKRKDKSRKVLRKGESHVRTVLINSDGQMRTVKDIVFMLGTWMI